jgi:hypothetical protein
MLPKNSLGHLISRLCEVVKICAAVAKYSGLGSVEPKGSILVLRMLHCPF